MIYHSPEETQNFAEELAKKYKDSGVVLALSGELGAGKTTFTQGFAKGLGIDDKVISPTFVLIRQHPLPNSKKMLFHIDLYRLEGEISLEQLGIKEMIEGDNFVLIEWAEKIKDQLPEDTVWLEIKKISEEEREIIVY